MKKVKIGCFQTGYPSERNIILNPHSLKTFI